MHISLVTRHVVVDLSKPSTGPAETENEFAPAPDLYQRTAQLHREGEHAAGRRHKKRERKDATAKSDVVPGATADPDVSTAVADTRTQFSQARPVSQISSVSQLNDELVLET